MLLAPPATRSSKRRSPASRTGGQDEKRGGGNAIFRSALRGKRGSPGTSSTPAAGPPPTRPGTAHRSIRAYHPPKGRRRLPHQWPLPPIQRSTRSPHLTMPDLARRRRALSRPPSSLRGPEASLRHQRRPAQSRRCAPHIAQRPWTLVHPAPPPPSEEGRNPRRRRRGPGFARGRLVAAARRSQRVWGLGARRGALASRRSRERRGRERASQQFSVGNYLLNGCD